MGKSPSANAEETGSIPGSGRFHMPPNKAVHHTGLLSTLATATEAYVPRVYASQEKPLQWEAPAPQLENNPHRPQLEKAQVHQQIPTMAKN